MHIFSHIIFRTNIITRVYITVLFYTRHRELGFIESCFSNNFKSFVTGSLVEIVLILQGNEVEILVYIFLVHDDLNGDSI